MLTFSPVTVLKELRKSIRNVNRTNTADAIMETENRREDLPPPDRLLCQAGPSLCLSTLGISSYWPDIATHRLAIEVGPDYKGATADPSEMESLPMRYMWT